MKIHLAILTYNALAYTKRCIDSLLRHTTLPMEVHIVDNASTDGTQAWLAALDDPRFCVHASPTNLGVPGGRNELLRQILPRCADEDFVVFLDNDIELHEGWHKPFQQLFEAQPRAGMASKVGWVMQVREDTRDPHTQPWETGRVDMVAGGFACWARVEAIRAVGLLDENLGLFWHEDDDWSLRFTAHGWSLWAVPEAGMLHHEHASGVAWPSLESGDSQRNLAYLAKKWKDLGYVDEEGWVRDRDPLFTPSLALRAEMKRRLGRHSPISRGEYVESYWDLHAMLATLEFGRAFPRPVSPCLRILLELLCEGRFCQNPPEVQARYEALSRNLAGIRSRREAGLGQDIPGGPGETPWNPEPGSATPTQGLPRCDSWENEAWLAAFHEVKGPGSTSDWYGRCSPDWTDASAFLWLSKLGLLRPGRRGLILDPREVSLAIAIAERGTDLLLAGHFDIASEARGELPPEFLAHPDRWLGGEGRSLRACRRSQLMTEAPFDFVIAGHGLVTDGEDRALQSRLQEMQRCLAPGGHAALIVEVLVGMDGQTSFRPADSMAGLTLIPGFQAFTDTETLASSTVPISRGRVPDLCRRHGTVFQTHALLLYKKPAEPTLLHPQPHPESIQSGRDFQVLVDLRGVDWDQWSSQDSAREGLAQIERVMAEPGHPQVTILGDLSLEDLTSKEGSTHDSLRRLLLYPDLRYRSALEDLGSTPDLIQYLEAPRKAPPRCHPTWRDKPIVSFLGGLSREGLLHGQDPWSEAAWLHFLQRESKVLILPGRDGRQDLDSWLRDSLDLGDMDVRFAQASHATLQDSPCSQQEAQILMGVTGPYLLLEGSLGARDRFAELLALMEGAVLGKGLTVLAYGREFQGFDALCQGGGHPVLGRMRFVEQIPETLRRPLFEGADCLVDARHEPEFRLGAREAAEIGLSLQRYSSGRLMVVEGSGAPRKGLEPDPMLGEIWRDLMEGDSPAPKAYQAKPTSSIPCR